MKETTIGRAQPVALIDGALPISISLGGCEFVPIMMLARQRLVISFDGECAFVTIQTPEARDTDSAFRKIIEKGGK